jgi:alkylated DNA nucleotide flippase Atl1
LHTLTTTHNKHFQSTNMQPTIEQREARIKQRLAFHHERIEKINRAPVLRQEWGGPACLDHKDNELLAYHRRKIEFLNRRDEELKKERRHRRVAMKHVDEARSAPARDDPTGTATAPNSAPPTRPNAMSPLQTIPPAVPSNTTAANLARREQDKREAEAYGVTGQRHYYPNRPVSTAQPSHAAEARVFPSRKKVDRPMQIWRAQMAFANDHPHLLPEPDPFADRGARTAPHTLEQELHLARISADPAHIPIFPFTQAYLEETPFTSTDELRHEAKRAMQRHLGVEDARNALTQKMQDLHELIASHPDLSDLTKLTLLITTFIPQGHVASYRTIREWVHDARAMTPEKHIASALRKSPFSIDDVPIHRVIERNGGARGEGCAWGSHMPEVDGEWHREILEQEGCGFDRIVRVKGGVMHVHEVEAAMKGSVVGRFVDEFPRRVDRRIFTA